MTQKAKNSKTPKKQNWQNWWINAKIFSSIFINTPCTKHCASWKSSLTQHNWDSSILNIYYIIHQHIITPVMLMVVKTLSALYDVVYSQLTNWWYIQILYFKGFSSKIFMPPVRCFFPKTKGTIPVLYKPWSRWLSTFNQG